MPAPEVVPEVAAPMPALVTMDSKNGSGKDGTDEGGVAAIALAPVRKDEPIVTRRVSFCCEMWCVCWLEGGWLTCMGAAGTVELLL